MNISFTNTSPLPTSPAQKPKQSDTAQKPKDDNQTELSPEDRKLIQELKARDREVRAHEAAHVAAGAGLVRGGTSFTYQRGPDGVQYAVGGEVKIDTSKVEGDPEATIEKAQRIKAAALAPAEPSSQDRAVAAKAAQLIIEARAELNQTQQNTKQEAPNSTNKDNTDKETNVSGILFDAVA